MQELTVATEGFDDAADISIVRDVAACSAGHQDFDAELTVLFHQQSSLAELSSGRGSHQSSGAASDNDEIPRLFGVWHDGDRSDFGS